MSHISAKRYERCALTPAQKSEWQTTRAALLWHCPAFTHIFYKMLNNAGSEHIAVFTKDIPIAATDGDNLLLNPDTFFKYTLNERVFAVAHEIMHCVFHHCSSMFSYQKKKEITYQDGTKLEYQQKTANTAMDLVINDALIESKVGAFNSDWLHDTSLGTAKDSWIDVYRKVFHQGPPSKGSSFDEHLVPGSTQGQDATSAANNRNQAAWASAVAAGAAFAKSQGKLPAGLERLFGELLEPKVEWKDHIRSLIMRRVGTDAYDWRFPDRRLISRASDPIYAPRRRGFGAGDVVIAIDTSGSIGPKELDMFFAEMAGIMEDVKPERLFVMWCDAHVHRVDLVEEMADLVTLRAGGAPGGGGTSFVPVFVKIDEEQIEPDALVYLTDGFGSFPSLEPTYPVIWGDIGGTKYPFGDVVEIPKQAA